MTEQADRLLYELENLKQLLDKPLDSNASSIESDLDAVEGIPLLNDQIPTLQEESLTLPGKHSEFEAPLSDQRIVQVVDVLVAEYMPALEKKLRDRLLAELSFNIEAL